MEDEGKEEKVSSALKTPVLDSHLTSPSNAVKNNDCKGNN